MTAIDSLLAERDALRAEYAALRSDCRRKAELIESYDTVTAGPEATAKEHRRLEDLSRTVTATAGQWETTARELRREVWALRNKLGTRA